MPCARRPRLPCRRRPPSCHFPFHGSSPTPSCDPLPLAPVAPPDFCLSLPLSLSLSSLPPHSRLQKNGTFQAPPDPNLILSQTHPSISIASTRLQRGESRCLSLNLFFLDQWDSPTISYQHLHLLPQVVSSIFHPRVAFTPDDPILVIAPLLSQKTGKLQSSLLTLISPQHVPSVATLYGLFISIMIIIILFPTPTCGNPCLSNAPFFPHLCCLWNRKNLGLNPSSAN